MLYLILTEISLHKMGAWRTHSTEGTMLVASNSPVIISVHHTIYTSCVTHYTRQVQLMPSNN